MNTGKSVYFKDRNKALPLSTHVPKGWNVPIDIVKFSHFQIQF